MTPAGRLQAAIEILDLVIQSTREDGPPADVIVSRYFKTRRYAGSKDRRAVRELVFKAVRRTAERPDSGRAAVLGLTSDDPELLELFGEPRGPEPLVQDEHPAEAGVVPRWLLPELSPVVAPEEQTALVQRAPLDLRVNVSRTSRDAMLRCFPEGSATSLSLWGIRLPSDSRVAETDEYRTGLVEIQDEGSQLVALACDGAASVLDLCAGAGGKSLAIAAAAPETQLLATDSNRSRLSNLPPRAERAGAKIEVRLLNPPNELQELADWRSRADLVLVDAPCSGSGTWRRNPEARWRLTPERLDRLVALQQRLLGLAAELVCPGGSLVYAVCSLLSREGEAQIGDFLGQRSSWAVQDILKGAGRSAGHGRLLTPAHDETDGFFVARLTKPC